MKKSTILFLTSSLITLISNQVCAQTPNSNGVIFVKPVSTGTGDGSSWENAMDNIQNAIDASGVSKVFVAIGNYPISTYTVMKNNVAIYGGFDPDNGIDDLTDTRILPNVSINEGSVLDGGNTITPIRNYNNGLNNTAILDGFTIKNGRDIYGGAIYNSNAAALYRNLVLKNNEATTSGGAIYNVNSPAVYIGVIIEGNTAQYGGGLQNVNSSPSFTNAIIRNNTATMATAGAGGGAVFNQNSNASFVNCLIENNTTEFQGGAFVNLSGVPTLTNVTIANNSATVDFSGLDVRGDSVIVNNSIIFGTNNGDISKKHSLVEGQNDTDNGNIDATSILASDIFVDEANGNYSLLLNSVALNAGEDTLFQGLNYSTTDIVSGKRKAGTAIDLGAYEYQIFPSALGVAYVKPTATGTGLGNDWDNATDELQDAINATNVQKVFVSIGVYPLSSYSLKMKNNVAIYGGFDPDNGIEELLDARILPNLSNDEGSVLDGLNSRRIIFNTYIDTSAILDGFTIKNGKSGHGAAIANQQSSPLLNNLVIKNNNATTSGGAIYNLNSNAIIQNTIIKDNVALYGGGIRNNLSNSELTNVSIIGNSATMATTGAGGAGIFNELSSMKLTNVLIANNTTEFQGGAFVNLSGVPTLTNVTIANNSATVDFSGLDVRGDSVIVNNSIIFGTNNGDISKKHSLVEGQNDTDNGNIDATGITATAIFADLVNNDFTVLETSPTIDAGNNELFINLSATTLDLAGNPRLNHAIIDLGAYEYDLTAGLNDLNLVQMSVYPNPTSSLLTINIPTSSRIKIINMSGNVIYDNELNAGTHTIDVNNLVNGLYILQTDLGLNFKIIKE
ncbi:MAG TPA: choice-of-anchor Q domain-containing protein [Taishania sp.]|nr:choice-of-anchor Q domain-containing protein [Taishania sp.]